MNLQLLGLTSYEAKVYEALIKIGKASASQIAHEAQVSYGRIYDVLATLERKGLVVTVPEMTKKFMPGPPEKLMELIKAQEEELIQTKDDITKLAKMYELHEQPPVTVLEGKRNFYKVVKERPEPKKTNYTIRYTSEQQPVWHRKHKEHIRKGVDDRTLVRYDKETAENVHHWLKFHKQTRILDNDGIAMHITDEDYLFIAMIKSNVTLIIRDKPFIKLMKKMFLETYNAAENPNVLKEK